MICIIDHKNTVVEYKSSCLYIARGRGKKVSIPITQLEQVIVYGNPLVQTSVWRNLAAASIPVTMISARGKPQVAMLGSTLAVRLPLRRMQHRLADNSSAATDMAKWFIRRKIKSYSLSLAALAVRFNVKELAENNFLTCCSISKQQLEEVQNVGQVMGIEGRLANNWFSLLYLSLPEQLNFKGRNRRPPLDPVNSLLSLAYTMLLSEIRQALLSEGFDPSLGFLHQDYPGRESLSLDFMEIFRSGVDELVLRWLAETSLDESSFFYRKKDGCRLSKAMRPLFFQAWAEQRESWPRFDSRGEAENRAPLRELILGQLASARHYMKRLEELHVPERKPDTSGYGWKNT